LATEEDREGTKPIPYAVWIPNDQEWVVQGRDRSWYGQYLYAIPIATPASTRRKELEKRLKDAEALVASVREDLAKEDV